MTVLLTLKRIELAATNEMSTVPDAATTAAQVNAALAKYPDCIHCKIEAASEAQLRGLLQYAKLIDNGATTTSVESAVTALW